MAKKYGRGNTFFTSSNFYFMTHYMQYYTTANRKRKWHCDTLKTLKSSKTRNILDCDQSNVLLARIIFSCILLIAFSSFLFTPQIAVPTASPRRQHQPCNWRHHVTWPQKGQTRDLIIFEAPDRRMVLSIVTMRLSSTVMEIWPFEVLSERLFQEQRSVVGQSVGPQYCTDLIYSSSLR